MKEPIIPDLEYVTEKMINALERWLKNGVYARCPFSGMNADCEYCCDLLFENLSEEFCPCYFFGQDETVLAFTVICDVWAEYHTKP